MSNTIRLTGMASGLDTDTVVKQMMQSYQLKLDKMNQDKQIVQWKQDLYRDVLSTVNTFKSSYFDVLKSDSYMLSKRAYAGFDVTSKDSVSSTAVPGTTATAGTGTVPGTYAVEVTQLAASAKKEGSALAAGVTGATKLSDPLINMTTDPFDFNITYGTTTKTISLSPNDTINKVIDKISAATSGNVVAKFSELTGKFTIETTGTGSTQTLSVSTNLTFLGNIDTTAATGKDAIAKIKPPGESGFTTVTKSTNTFSIDGMTYTLSAAGTTSNINVTANPQQTFDKIKTFVDKYNEMVDMVNKKTEEKRQYSYNPLTDEQKKDMEDADIKKWEEKAKEGLLKGDPLLQNMMLAMRSAFYEGVEGAGITLSEIGLSTSSDVSMRGKIIIDEAKLKNAITTKGEQVANLFTKTSETHPSYNPNMSQADRKVRSKEEGIFQRINDILQDYTRTTRDDNGKKGLMLEKAGIKGDFTEFNNLLSDQIKDKEKLISNMLSKMADKENRLYLQFSRLEQAMNTMNSQSSWLAQQLGGSAG